MKKVGIVGIDLKCLSTLHGIDALNASGNNFGNMLFTNAAHEQIKFSERIGFVWNVEEVKDNYSSILIPAANWLNAKNDWGDLASLIERTDLPCVIVGLGSQLDSLADVKDIPFGTKRLLKVISERSKSLGVRGEFTAEVVRACGVDNVEVLGCPSIFVSGTVPKIREIDLSAITRIGIGPTRYVLNAVNDRNRNDKQRQLYQFAIREASSIYFQSESYEIKMLSRDVSISDEENETAKEYYGCSSHNELSNLLMLKGKYHTDLSHWIADVRKDDIYIGTRIHGVIAATIAGTPAILITHDNRTKELADYMAVPNVSIDDFEMSALYDLPYLLSKMDYAKYLRRSDNNLKRLMSFYKLNGIESNLYYDNGIK
ncbi:polysaccharide pyruvyl transferase family protein [Amphritea pacifica]|uniref:Polysaccharide pyruvyl transferase family protein n=1 Tax=Amphritea pacifica TaxID=2811233 RepID=A0ABS2W5M1_9GAMM|nr:polysaccharide pyruvyl transferase family protein [Amphritea pacifica]MBN0987014.1 polysaccharide pyruvyl transferase family protein [Amphritea pacifica]